MTPPNKPIAAANPSRTRLPKRTAGLLAVVILFGALLRLVGLGWSLPDTRHPLATYHPDERINLNAALQADVSHLKFDIGFYNYGAFYFYLANVAQIVGRGYGIVPKLPEDPHEPPPSVEQLAKANAGLFLMGRLVTALMGIAAIPVVFALGRRCYSDNVGLFAALLYAVAPLAVIHAHFFTVDVPATLFVALALLSAARLLERITLRGLILAGVWTGLAAATKYNAVLVILAPIAALLIKEEGKENNISYLTPDPSPDTRASAEERGEQSQTRRSPSHSEERAVGRGSWKAFALVLAATVITFLIACPGVWLNFDAFWNGIPNYPGSGVRYELFEHSREGHGELFLHTGIGAIYHLIVSLWQGLGFPFLVLLVVGSIVAFKRRTPADRVLLVFFLVSYFLYSLSAVRFARYMLPLFPVICVLAARVLLEAKANKNGRNLRLFALVVAIWTSIYSLSFTNVMRGKDPRDRAADWMERNANPGATVAFGRIPWFSSPPLNPRFGLTSAPQRAAAVNDTSRYTFRISSTEWDVSILTPPPDYVIISNLETMHPLRLDNPSAIAFITAAEKDRRAEIFSAGVPFILIGGNRSLIAEDMLYILPKVAILH